MTMDGFLLDLAWLMFIALIMHFNIKAAQTTVVRIGLYILTLASIIILFVTLLLQTKTLGL